MQFDPAAPSPWATGLTNREAIRLDDLRMTRHIGTRPLDRHEAAECQALQEKIGRALHGQALAENAERSR